MGAVAAPAGAAGPLPPTVQVDTRFAPPSGIAEYDFTSGIATDRAAAVAVDGNRIYTVGEAQSSGNRDVAVIARRSDGAFDSGFSDDGRLLLAVRPGLGSRDDSGADVIVLPDHRLRILAATAANPLATADLEVAIVGLNPDGSPDTSFGAGTGSVVFSVSVNADIPARMAIDAATGRIAIAGGTGGSGLSGGKDDTFVSLREADGSPVAGFGANGVVTLNFAGATKRDRAVDVAFRPGGGVVALIETESAPNVLHSVLHALTVTGQADASFGGGTGDVALAVGEPNTTAGGLLAAGGRLWVTGSTKVGNDTDAYLARVDSDGANLVSRRFDFLGKSFTADQGIVSTGRDLALLGGPVPTLVVAGKAQADNGSAWGAAAFNTFDGDVAAAQIGDVVTGATGAGIAAIAPAATDWLAAAGTTEETTSDTTIGTARLLVDADKTCDLALRVAAPLEVVFAGSRPGPVPLSLRVSNAGTRSCAGAVTAAGPYALRASGMPGPVSTGLLAPGDDLVLPGIDVAYTGPRRRDDVLSLALHAEGDTEPENDVATVRVSFRYCDARLSRAGSVRAIPSEGRLRLHLLLSNAGTVPCARAGVALSGGGRAISMPPRATLDAGLSVDADATVEVTPAPIRAASATLRLRALADDDADPAGDALAITAPVVRVGDSRIARAGRRRVSGSATRGGGAASRARRRVRRVEVAVRRLGRGCAWLAASGALRRRSGVSDAACAAHPVWLRARGKRRWSLRLPRALPAGRYVALSRATIRAGFPEARFSARDGNRVSFRVR
jgi:hypothetical protein